MNTIFRSLFVINHKKITSNSVLGKIALSFLYITVTVLFLVWVLFLVMSMSDRKTVESSDFVAFYTAGILIREGEAKSLYDIDVQLKYQSKFLEEEVEEPIVFRYLPFVSSFFYPFTLFPFAKAYLLFVVINIIATVFILGLIRKTFMNISNFKLWFFLPFAYYPVALSILKGQLTVFLVLILLIMYRLFMKKPFWAGCLYSLFLIKPHFFIAGLPFFFLITKKRKMFLTGVFLFMVVELLISVNLSGIRSLLLYPAYTILKEESIYQNVSEWVVNLNLSLILTPLVNFLGGKLIDVYFLGSIIYIGFLYIFARGVRVVKYEHLYFTAVIFMLILSLHSYPYDYALLFIPLLILLNDALGRKKDGYGVLFFVIFWLLLPNIQLMNYLLIPLVYLFAGYWYVRGVGWSKNLNAG